MANVKISELPVAASVDGASSFPVVEGGVTKQVTFTGMLASPSLFASGMATFFATPSSANLRAALTDETGTGAAVFADSPTLTGAVSVTGTVAATKLIPTGNVTAGNGMYLPATNEVAISTNGTERLRIDASGNLGAGSNPSSSARIFGLSTDSQHGVYGQTQGTGASYYGVYGLTTKTVSSGGVIGISTNGTTYGILGYFDGAQQWAGYFSGSTFSTGTYQGSDARLKDNVQTLSESLAKIGALRPVEFDWKPNSDAARAGQTHDMGLIAQEAINVLPSIVREVKGANPLPNADPSLNAQLDYFYTIEYTRLIPVLIGAVQEQQAIIDDLRARVAALEA